MRTLFPLSSGILLAGLPQQWVALTLPRSTTRRSTTKSMVRATRCYCCTALADPVRSLPPFLENYASSYRVILPDLRGHGRSTNPSGEFTHRQAARMFTPCLDKLGIQRVRGIGTSTGG